MISPLGRIRSSRLLVLISCVAPRLEAQDRAPNRPYLETSLTVASEEASPTASPNVNIAQFGDTGLIAGTIPTTCPIGSSSAIVVVVDGLQFLELLPAFYLPFINWPDDYYLRDAIVSMGLPIPSSHIFQLSWSRDAQYDTLDSISDLRSLLRLFQDCARQNGQKLIVVSHSWGTFLTVKALEYESCNPAGPIVPNLLITLGSPLGAKFAPYTSDWPYLPCILPPIDGVVADYVDTWSTAICLLDFACCTSPSLSVHAERWLNYWAWGDAVSGPLTSLGAWDVKIDPNSNPACAWTRQFGTTWVWHSIDSLEPDSNYYSDRQNLREIIAAQIKSILPVETCEPNDSQAHACHLHGITEPVEYCNASITPNDVDWYDFAILQKSISGSYLEITFSHANGDLDICLYKDETELRCSRGTSNTEQVSLNGYCTGFYALKVFGKNGATNPSYCLKIVPPGDTFLQGSFIHFGNDPSRDENWDDSIPCVPNNSACNGIPECLEDATVDVVFCASEDLEGVVVQMITDYGASSEKSLGFLPRGTCISEPFGDSIPECDGETTRYYAVFLEYSVDCIQYKQILWFDHTFPGEVSYRLRVCDQNILVDRDCTPNGILDSGDNARVTLSLENYGSYAIQDVSCAVDPASCTQHPCVTIDNNQIDYDGFGNIGPGECVESGGSFRIEQVCAGFSGPLSCDLLCRFDGRDPNDPLRIEDGFRVTIDPQARLQVAPAEHDFGAMDLNVKRTVAIEARNTGTEPLTISSIEVIKRATDIVQVTPSLPWPPILAGGFKAFTVDVTPTSCGRIEPPIQVVLYTGGCVRSPGEDRIVIGGTVCIIPSCTIADLTSVRDPDVSGDWMVYTRPSAVGTDVFAYNMRTGEELQLTSDAAHQFGARISGSLVAWSDTRNDPSTRQVYAFDLSAPQLGAFRVAPNITPLPDEVILGVDGNLVAFSRRYELLYDTPTDAFPEDASNLLVYAYQGNGQFTVRYSSGWTPGTGTQDRQSVQLSNSDGDFGGGLLVFERFTWFWDGNSWEENRDQHIEVIDLAAGDTAPRRARNTFADTYCAFDHSFGFADNDAAGDLQVFVWRPGGIEQVTPVGGECSPGGRTLACGRCDGVDHVLYDYGSCDRPGIYDLDLTTRVERLLCDGCDPDDELRMDGCRLTWRDQSRNFDLHFALMSGAECTGDAACDDSNVCTVDECACVFCRHKPACTSNAECSDGVFCNGTEQCAGGCCNPGAPPSCDDGIACTTDSCDAETNACVHVPHDFQCDDGKFCTGIESCSVATGCVAGLPPVCDDGVACTVDICDAESDECVSNASDALCDDDLFCNGAERCDSRLGCLTGLPPCDDGINCTQDSCNGVAHTCQHVQHHELCADGLYCNGNEICDLEHGCQSGTSPCNDGSCCNENSNSCGAAITSTYPDNCAIDARQPHLPGNPSALQGWNSLAFTFGNGCGIEDAAPSDFSVACTPTSPDCPTIPTVIAVDQTVTVMFSSTIPSGTWTCVTHLASGSVRCIGSLPGDASNNKATGPADILEIIDNLNGVRVPPMPIYQCDIDRSNICGPADIITEIDLLNGNGFQVWNGRTLELCPSEAP